MLEERPREQTTSFCAHGQQRSACKGCGAARFLGQSISSSSCHPQMSNTSEEPPSKRAKSTGCEHGRQRSACKECGGTGICQHGRRRSQCKECGGSGICQHGREGNRCKECGGTGICQHGRQRSTCKECGGSGICQHGRKRSSCKECGGASICLHGRWRTTCKECAGVYIGRTVQTQLDGQSACQGTVVDFKTKIKFTIQYTDNTTSTLTMTQLKKALMPIGEDHAPARAKAQV